jgi:hypothetical protein
MESSAQPPVSRRSVGEWLFQLTTITVGVLVALSFDALLKWNDERKLVDEARANIALEIEENRRELEGHLASYDERIGRLDNVLRLLDQQDAGVELETGTMNLGVSFPSLNDAGWQTARQTGAVALMDYADVERLAELYTMQALVVDNIKPSFAVLHQAAAIVETASDPLALPQPTRDTLRARTLELRGILRIDEQIGRQLLSGYDEHLANAPR